MTSERILEAPTEGRTGESPTGGRRLEYPIRGVHTHKKKKWEIFDVGTGELLETFRVGKGRFIFVVLDGEHVITDDYKVFSLEQKKDIQDVGEIEKFFGITSEEKREFLTLPPPEKCAYVYQGESEYVFEHLEVKKLVTYSEGGKQLGVWNWDGRKLEKDYVHEFAEEIETVLGLSKLEVGMSFSNSLLTFNVEEKKRGAFVYSPNSRFFVLPSGGLGFHRRGSETETISELTLPKLQKREIARFREAQRYLIFNSCFATLATRCARSQGLTTLIWRYKKPWEYTVAEDRQRKIVKIEGETPVETEGYLSGTDFFSSPFHDGDLAMLSGSGKERKMEFVDIITGKKKQVLEVPYVMGFKSEILPGDRYLVDAENDQVLLEFKEGRYQVVRRIPYVILIPASRKQKENLKRDLDTLFVEAGAKIPKEITGVIFGFI